jgi:hypothetical protein
MQPEFKSLAVDAARTARGASFTARHRTDAGCVDCVWLASKGGTETAVVVNGSTSSP